MMIPFYDLVVGFILVSTVFEFYLDFRQYQCDKSKTVPSAVRQHVDEAEFIKSQDYQRAKREFGLLRSAFSLTETLLFLHFEVLPFFWNYASALLVSLDSPYFPNSEIPRSLVFMFIINLYNTLIGIPFSLYSNFVLEERFGFNKLTARIFIMDLLKGQMLTVLLGTPVLSAIIYCINWGGESFYLYLWLLILLITIIGITIYPTIIAPLFNKFTPLEEGELRSKIYALAEKLNFPLTKLFVVDGSTRSSHSNAYFFGFFKNKRIVLFDTLLEQCDHEGVVAVLAHEMGHWKYSHTLKMLLINQVYIFVFLFTFSYALYEHSLYAAFGFDQPAAMIGIMLFSYIYSPMDHAFHFVMNMLSRRFEFQADEFASHLGLDLEPPLVCIHIKNLGSLVCDPWYSAYHHSHPTLVERLEAIRRSRRKST
mmetsp:Transcript_13881/g.35429  ORF Transcript_13881/g.35429 Transcript_13881/m.35429 type:complete len:424 (+) Transcript_13881:3-1274(+)